MQQDKCIEKYFYNTGHVIGKGNYGCVYKGVDQNTQTDVAIKIVKKTKLEGESYSQKAFINEMMILKKLSSKNIVKLFDVCESQSNYYLIQELCQQGDLKKILKEQQLNEKEAIKILRDILSGYQILLKYGIVHRDIKPANILNSNGVFKLGDFGLATQISKQKMLNQCVGTPLYMSPQVQQHSNYTSKCDIWSIGILFYESLYGATPWYHETSQKLLKKIYEETLEFPTQPFVSDVSKSFIKSCLEINEKDRIDWVDIYNHSIFRSNPFQKLDGNSQQIITRIRNIMKIRKFNINQLIQNILLPKKLNIDDLNLLLQSIDKQFTLEDAEIVFNKLNHNNRDTIPFECVLLWFSQNDIILAQVLEFCSPLLTQQDQSKIDDLLDDLITRLRLNSISIIEICKECGVSQNQEISLNKFEQILLKIDIKMSKADITLLYRKNKQDNQGIIRRESIYKMFYEESELDDADDDFSVSPVHLPFQGPGLKLQSCNNIERLS
ncbi:unnamed protein product (macronuclear) [Paramecium tetraurelia]|uniref:non-specific serine/threonine protein kinase n=1 Tax=Paramecium tetraurelia TaxID=5888 RepID=A0DNC5_PARTE|nr:uncharacterized protein GSPATT00018737001 [Paramecium tetraurelia]CAK84542.1 unnamed protein product [Paramecium tetraurelia]|eukprot:XP_001451939.1 hypothetical protein (macronuclear) [Paramecium tetraurelia strain d4-2]